MGSPYQATKKILLSPIPNKLHVKGSNLNKKIETQKGVDLSLTSVI
jgi:hypothetical protein